MAKIYSNPASTFASTIFISKGITAQAAKAGAMASTGPSKNNVLFEAVGRIISLKSNFNPSATGCNKPK